MFSRPGINLLMVHTLSNAVLEHRQLTYQTMRSDSRHGKSINSDINITGYQHTNNMKSNTSTIRNYKNSLNSLSKTKNSNLKYSKRKLSMESLDNGKCMEKVNLTPNILEVASRVFKPQLSNNSIC